MAWPTPTLDDLILSHDTGGKRWLHALCRAVNERQIGLGLAQTKFILGDETEGSSIDVSDLTGIWVGGERDGAITNLNRCMVAIKAMLQQVAGFVTIGSFLQSPGYGATAWGLGSIQTDVGLGVFPTGTDRFTDLNFWKQMKEALDRMTICRKISPANSGSLTIRQSTGANPDIEVGWDAARALSPSSASWSNFDRQVGWFVDGFQAGPFSGNYDVVFRSNGNTSFGNACAGSLDEAYYVVSARASGTSAPSWELTPSGGTPIAIPDTYTGRLSGPDLALGNSNFTAYTYTAALPSTHPSTFYQFFGGWPPGGVVVGYWAALDMQYADFYFQPTLTDQA